MTKGKGKATVKSKSPVPSQAASRSGHPGPSASSPSSAIGLDIFCLLLPDDNPSQHIFSVTLRGDRTVDDLKDAIKLKRGNDLKDIDAVKLTLYKLKPPIVAIDVAKALRNLKLDGSDDELLPTAELSDVFPNGVVRGHLHIVVKTPDYSLELLEELRKFFEWNPPPLRFVAQTSKSTASRKPSFYDKLLDEKCILHHVRLLPSLAEDIASTADAALQSINERGIQLPPLTTGFPTAKVRLSARVDLGMKNEGSVAQFYSRTTADYCATVASMLELHPNVPFWTSILTWTNSPSRSGYAVADGSINLLGYKDPPQHEFDRMRKQVWDSLKPSTRQELLLVKEFYPDLATWEIKSLSVGTPEVMMGVIRETSTGVKFRWERQDSIESKKSRRRFDTPLVGPDATVTPWNLGPISTSSTSSGSMDAPESSTSSRIPGQALGGSRARGASTSTTQKVKKPTTQRAKKRRLHNDDENYKDHKEITAEMFLQQAWAQAVRHDSTLIILHSGNYEFVGVRHRKTQTLYLSNMIDVAKDDSPAYGKLHVGIYIAALRDAINRVSQRSGAPGQPSDMENITVDEANEEGDDGHKGGDRGGSRKGKGRERDSGGGASKRRRTRNEPGNNDQGIQRCGAHEGQDEQLKYAISECNSRNVLLVHFQYGIYNSPFPASFMRFPSAKYPRSGVLPPRVSPRHKLALRPEEYLMLVVTSEIADGAIGVVHGGVLEIESSGPCLFLDVVVKLAFTDRQQDSLKHEYSIYQHLVSKRVRGIPTPLGLFNSLGDGPSALLMTHSGVRIDSGMLSTAARQEFLMVLKEIHKFDVLHGDIRRQNLLIDNTGHAVIIDFDQARITSSARAKEGECKQLLNVLAAEEE